MFDGVGIDFCFQLQLPLVEGHKTLLPPDRSLPTELPAEAL